MVTFPDIGGPYPMTVSALTTNVYVTFSSKFAASKYGAVTFSWIFLMNSEIVQQIIIYHGAFQVMYGKLGFNLVQ